MSEMKELFDMTTKQIEPDLDSWKQQEDRQRRRGRNRRVGAFAVAAAVVLAALIAFAASLPGDRSRPEPADQPTLDASVPPRTLEPDAQDVAIVDLRGEPVAGIANLPEDAFALSLSSDRTTVAFVTAAGSQMQIATIQIDGTAMEVLETDVSATMPAWSPDGERIAFVGEVDGQDDVFVMDADGSDVRRVTTDAADDIYPRWSPDGITIAYTNVGDEPNADDPQFSTTADIWTIPANGGTATRLTTAPGPDAQPDYSPDGSQIAYYHDDSIRLMDADGGNGHLLLHTGTGAFTPRWSPDGSWIAYTDYDASYRPYVTVNGRTFEAPLVMVQVVDPQTGRHHAVGDVGMATDTNVPEWWSDDLLLIRRVGH